MNIHLAVGVRKYIFFCCKFHIDFFTQCYFFFFFIFFFFAIRNEHTRNGTTTYRFLIIAFSLAYFSFVSSDSRDEKIHFFHQPWYKEIASSVSFLSFSFFFLVFVCFLNISRREYAGPPSPPFFLFFLFVCLFVSFVFI